MFKSYVFVHVTEEETEAIKNIVGVVNMLYWLGQPAVIKEDEIAAIKEFTNDHRNIKLERTVVNINDVARNFNAPSYAIEGKIVTVKNKTIKINLPSLGYTMIAKMEDESIFGINESTFQNKSYVQS